MRLVHLRLSLPDRPGALGRLARALGEAGADIAAITVLDQEAGRAVDDIHVRWPDGRPQDLLTAALASVPGVTLLGLRGARHLPGTHPDLDLFGQVIRGPERALATLVDMAPSAFAADWAAAVTNSGEVVAASLAAPEQIAVGPLHAVRATSLTGHQGEAHAVVPIDAGCRLVLTRDDGLTFHRLELMRLARVVDLVRLIVLRDLGPAAIPGPGTGTGAPPDNHPPRQPQWA